MDGAPTSVQLQAVTGECGHMRAVGVNGFIHAIAVVVAGCLENPYSVRVTLDAEYCGQFKLTRAFSRIV
jgi:hypothetical protein